MSLFQLQILLPKMLNVRFPTFCISIIISSFHVHNFTLYYTTPAQRFPAFDAMVVSM